MSGAGVKAWRFNGAAVTEMEPWPRLCMPERHSNFGARVMDLRNLFRRITSPRPRTIEVGAQIAALLILLFGAVSIWRMPPTDFTQEKMLPLFNVPVGALGVALEIKEKGRNGKGGAQTQPPGCRPPLLTPIAQLQRGRIDFSARGRIIPHTRVDRTIGGSDGNDGEDWLLITPEDHPKKAPPSGGFFISQCRWCVARKPATHRAG
jgi:hypothetical protein